LKRLLARGANPNAELSGPTIQRQHTFGDMTLGQGATPLLRASKSGDIAAVRLLLEAGADPRHTMPNGATALLYAAGYGWRYGSPIAPSFDQGSEEEAVETIKLFLELGLDLHAKTENGDTVLHAAVQRDSDVIVKFLLEAGADPTAVNGRDQTPLTYASETRRASPEVIELLQAATPSAAATVASAPTP
jgi:ankyrin repeat protein